MAKFYLLLKCIKFSEDPSFICQDACSWFKYCYWMTLHGKTFWAAGAPALEQKLSRLLKSKACTRTGSVRSSRYSAVFLSIYLRCSRAEILCSCCSGFAISTRESKHSAVLVLWWVNISCLGQLLHWFFICSDCF